MLSACIQPVDVEQFMANEVVEEQIEKNKVKVIISGDSDSGLTAGNGKISGLKPGKYYKIEKLDGNGDPEETNFVKADGTLSGSLKDIRKVSVNVINGLTNDVTYRVKSAVLYNNTTGKIKYFKLSDTTTTDAALANGTVTFSKDSQEYYFDLSNTIDAKKYYEVMKVKVSGAETAWTNERTSAYRRGANPSITSSLPEMNDTDYTRFNKNLNIGIYEFDPSATNGYTGTITPSFLPNMSIAKLPEINTENDYVFVESDGTKPATPTNPFTKSFYVLTVKVEQAKGGATITIPPPTIPTDDKPILTYSSGTIINDPINEGDVVHIQLATGGTITAGAACNWYYNNNTTPFATNTTITIDTPTIGTPPLDTAGTYTIMVEKTVGGVDYSTWFILKIE
jgi:hypothetical protein